MNILISILLASLYFTTAFAQQLYHPHSYHEISSEHILWHKTLWRKMDLRRPDNRPYFSHDKRLTEVILQAALCGRITTYASDDLDSSKTIALDKLHERLQIRHSETRYTSDDIPYLMNTFGYTQGEAARFINQQEAEYVFPIQGKDVYELELREEYIFDRHRSQLRIDMMALNLYLPAEHPENPYGFSIPIGSFSFKELSETILDQYFCYNPLNKGHQSSFLSGFLRRSFDSYVVKIDNYEDAYLGEIYGDEELAYYMGQKIENDIRDLEYSLWVEHSHGQTKYRFPGK